MTPSRQRRGTAGSVTLRLVLMTSALLVAPLSSSLHRALAATEGGSWTVFQAVGDVRLRSDHDLSIWRQVRPGDALDGVYAITTGADGQATLTHGDDVIHISPGSRVEVRPPSPGNVVTRVVQSLGTLFFGVETRPDRRFRVETPYLVTFVKGTTFSVSVTDEGADVEVAEGTVSVVASEGRDSRDVGAGRAARVTAANPAAVAVGEVSSRGFARGPVAPDEVRGVGRGRPANAEGQVPDDLDTLDTGLGVTNGRNTGNRGGNSGGGNSGGGNSGGGNSGGGNSGGGNSGGGNSGNSGNDNGNSGNNGIHGKGKGNGNG